jgi:hypothetical protein
LESVTSGCSHLELLGYRVTAAIHCRKEKEEKENIKNTEQADIHEFF